MKKIFSIILITVLLLTQFTVIGMAASPDDVRIQGEDATGKTSAPTNASADGGKWAMVLNPSNKEISWANVAISKAAIYSFSIKYATPAQDATASLFIGSTEVASGISLTGTGSIVYDTARVAVLLDSYTFNATGNYDIKLKLTATGNVMIDYVDIVKIGDLGDNELDGETILASDTYYSKADDVTVNGDILEIPAGSNAVYNVKALTPTAYDFGLNATGDAQIEVYVDSDKVYTGEAKESGMFLWEFDSEKKAVKISVVSGTLNLEELSFVPATIDNVKLSAIKQRYEIEGNENGTGGGNDINKGYGTNWGMNGNNWVKIPIDVTAGLYEVSIIYGGTSTIDVKFATENGTRYSDDANSPDTVNMNELHASLETTTGFTTFKPAVAGIFEFPFDLTDEPLTMTITSTWGGHFDYIELQKADIAPQFARLKVGDKIMAENSEAHRGADTMDIAFDYYLNGDTVTSETLKVMCGTREIPYEASVTDNKIALKLKSSFDYNSDCKVIFTNGIESKTGIAISGDMEVPFKVGDDTGFTGATSISLDSITSDYENVTLSGTLLSSQGLGISGRTITISAKDRNGGDIGVAPSTAVTGENGVFNADLVLSGAVYGNATVYVTDEYGAEDNDAITYVSSSFEDDIILQFEQASDAYTVYEIIRDNKDILGITSVLGYNANTALYQTFVGKTFSSIDDIKNEYARFTTYHNATEGLNANRYALLTGGAVYEEGKLKLPLNATAEFYVNFDTSGFYNFNIDSLKNGSVEILLDGSLLTTANISEGTSYACTYNVSPNGNKKVTIKNISDVQAEITGISIPKVNTTTVKNGFETFSKLGREFRDVEGVGHHFAGNKGTVAGYDHVGINAGDWFYYDLGNKTTGLYKVVMNYATPQNPTLIFTDCNGTQTKVTPGKTGDGWANNVDTEFEIKIPEKNTYLHLTLESSEGISINKMTFTRIDTPLNFYAVVAGNTVAINNTFMRGTDKIEVHFTAPLKEVTASNLVLKTGSRTIPYEYELNDNVVTMKLRETLDYDTDYTLEVSGLESTTGMKMKESASVKMRTGGTAGDTARETITVEESEWNYETVTVKGNVKSNADVPIAGRKVKITHATATLTNNEGYTDENGEFEINCTIPTSAPTGELTFEAVSEYGFTDSFTVCYIPENMEQNTILPAINGASIRSEVETFFATYGDEMGLAVNTDIARMNETQKNALYDSFISRTGYTSVKDVISDYRKEVVLRTINSATDFNKVKAITDNAIYMTAFAGEEYVALYSEIVSQKNNMLNAVKELNDMSTADDLALEYTKIVEEYFLKEYGKVTLNAVTNGTSVNVNQSVNLITGITAKTEDIKKFEFTFISSTSDTILDNAQVTKGSTSLSGDKKTLTYVYNHDGSEINEIETMTLTAPSTAGSYIIAVSGKATYDITAKSGAVYTITDDITSKNITVTVSSAPSTSVDGATTSTPAPSGGGGGSITPKPDKDEEEKKDEENKDDETVTPAPDEAEEYRFTDLDDAEWASESIYYLVSKGIISKSEDKLFNPLRNVVREEFVKMIVTAFGLTDLNATAEFKDVDKNAWYYVYIASAVKYGIITGNPDGTFGIGKEISRQDMAVIIDRILTNLGYPRNLNNDAPFTDYDQISDYAKEAVVSVKNMGIINGVGDGSFAPKDSATRAQAAKMIYELIKICQ